MRQVEEKMTGQTLSGEWVGGEGDVNSKGQKKNPNPARARTGRGEILPAGKRGKGASPGTVLKK